MKIAEARGEIPLPASVLNEGSAANLLETIGRNDFLLGQRVKDQAKKIGGIATEEVSQWVNDALRTKALSNKGFAEWDAFVEKNLGNARMVTVPKTTIDAILPIVKVWESNGLVHQLDPTLVRTVQRIQAAVAAGTPISGVRLTMAEAESARSLLYNNARERMAMAANDRAAVGGETLAMATKKEAQTVSASMDAAMENGVQGKLYGGALQGSARVGGIPSIPVDVRANLAGARELWKKWKQGEVIMDELTIPIASAARKDGNLTSTDIFSALKRIDKQEEKFGSTLIDGTQRNYLTGMARAMQANEAAGKSGGFAYLAVRGSQIGLITGGIWASGVPFLALTPATFAFVTTNPTAAKWLISGMRAGPGTAAGARATRELSTLLVANGYLAKPDRQGE
jgi:hypothetical protein